MTGERGKVSSEFQFTSQMKKGFEAVKKIFFNDANVVFAFLFGSQAGNCPSAESDVDLAIFFKKAPGFFALNDLKGDLSDAFKKEVDIVVLNNAPPVICMQVLKNGVPLSKKNPRIYNDFFEKTIINYDDLKQTRRDVEKNILKGRIYA